MREEEILYLIDREGVCYLHYQDEEIKKIHMRSNEVMKTICFRYGRKIDEIRLFACKVLRIKQKVPILLDVNTNLIFFPLNSIRSKENIWISYAHIKKVKELKYACCVIVFKNKEELFVPYHRKTIQSQRRRCRKLLQLLRQTIV